MALIERVKNMIGNPRSEWPVVAAEPATIGSIYTGYVLILAAVGPIATIIRAPMLGIGFAIVTYLLTLVITYVLAVIVDALAPTFGGQKDLVQSLKLVAYSYTAAWAAGIFQLIPVIGALLVLVATIYSFYTFFLGAPVLRKATPEKAAGFAIVVVICGIVMGFVLSRVLLSAMFGGAMMASMDLFR